MSKVKVGGCFFNCLKHVCGSVKFIEIKVLLLCSFTYIERENSEFPNAGGLGFDPGQGTRSHLLQQLKIQCATTRIPHAAAETLLSQINIFKK